MVEAITALSGDDVGEDDGQDGDDVRIVYEVQNRLALFLAPSAFFTHGNDFELASTFHEVV